MRRKCRIWWPKQLSSTQPSSCNLLFGWFVSCSSDSLDIVVAFASNYECSSNLQSGLQETIQSIDGNMHVSLQDKTKFSLLGQYRSGLSNGLVFCNGMQEDDLRKSCAGRVDGIAGCCGQWSCGCLKFDGLLDQCRQMFIESGYWIELAYNSLDSHAGGICSILKGHHIHWNGEVVSQCDVHVIVYETPKYGAHHFSLRLWSPSEQGKSSIKKPKWVDELDQKKPVNDLVK